MYKFSINECIIFRDSTVYKIIDLTSREGFYCMETAYELINLHNDIDSNVTLSTKFIEEWAISLGFDEELVKILYL